MCRWRQEKHPPATLVFGKHDLKQRFERPLDLHDEPGQNLKTVLSELADTRRAMKQLMDWVSALVVQHNVESFEYFRNDYG